MTNESFMVRLLGLFADADQCDELWWQRDDKGGLQFYVNVNDVFAWGCADGERVTPDNIDALKAAFRDVAAVTGSAFDGAWYAPWLFAARLRQMRPQGAMYPTKEYFALWPLFDACGLERQTGLGNPRPRPQLEPVA